MFYSERLTTIGRWSPQTTVERPREKGPEGQRQTLRRVRELAPEEIGLSLAELQARADAAEAQAWEVEDDGFVTVYDGGWR